MELSDERWDDVGGGQIEVVARPVEICWQQVRTSQPGLTAQRIKANAKPGASDENSLGVPRRVHRR